MTPAQKITLMTVGSTISLATVSLPAQAESTGTAVDLFPLEEQATTGDPLPAQGKRFGAQVSVAVRPEAAYHPDLLRSVAHKINTANQDDTEDSVDISDLVDLSFLDQFIDEEGNIDLPLGITVYEAMGTTSIGFGGDFR